jgi:predicted TIM-barrel fold metal-dependent hydrolase
MLVDTGFPHEEFTGYSVDLKTFESLVPCRVFPIFRMSPSINEILKKPPSTFDEAVDIIEKRLEHAIRVEKVVAIKSIIAYETGLEIRKWTEKEADRAYRRFRKTENREDEKVLRDYFTVMGLKKAGEHDIPVQFHTGFGSAPVLNLYRANPMLLLELLADEEMRGTKVVLTHSGQPFTKETGYLCSVCPDCYCDVSSITTYSAPAIKNSMLEILELAPATRVMMGSDGVMVPETYWFGIKNGVRGLGEALGELVSSDWLTSSEAVEFAELILHKNAKRLYRL